MNKKNTEDLVLKLSENCSIILNIEVLKKNGLYWGKNGVGDRWAKKIFNYSVIYKKKEPQQYSENENDSVPIDVLKNFLNSNTIEERGIIGIFVHSKRTNIIRRNINRQILKETVKNPCVICGTNTNIVCDHKNDLYNDKRVLDVKTQLKSDFQPLCNHCNLQKRQVCKKEREENKIYSKKNILRYKNYKFEFPWEKKIFDKNDIECKNDTYWYDPVEFEYKIFCYLSYKIPIINEIKNKVKKRIIKIFL